MRPQKTLLEAAQFSRYEAGYCGLCDCLQRQFGFAARFTVNYDLLFLFFLLGDAENELTVCRCPAKLCRKKQCIRRSGMLVFTAKVSVLLYYWKLIDSWHDTRGLRKLASGVCALALRGAYRKAKKTQPALDARIRRQLDSLNTLEAEKSASLDRTADAFAEILRGCAAILPDEPQRRAAGECLYHVGRYIYLTDALQDLPEDLKTGSYNPLQYRYALTDGQLRPEDRAALLLTIAGSIDRACAAFALLAPRAEQTLTTNILYQGLPAVLQSVAAGHFIHRGHKGELDEKSL
ncbi:MAG: DUF5685 family protein [Oscillospiraceae bacterium]|nr:DUF5685 family protein [Oscillospiraceae bacterium]